MNFLILSTVKQTSLEKAITNAGHTFERYDPADFQMFISARAGYDSVYLNSKPITRGRFNAIIPRVGSNRAYASRLIKHFTENLGVYSLQSGRAIDTVADKFRTSQILSAAKIPVPAQMMCKNLNPADIDFVLEKLKLPLVCKPLSASKGVGVMILESELSASMTIEYLHKTDSKFLLQEWISTEADKGAQDLRVILLDGKIINAMRRVAPAGKYRANLSIDATGEKVKLTSQQQKLAIDSAAALDITFCGVDILTKTSDPRTGDVDYLLEINSNPGNIIQSITGHNHFEDVVKFLEINAPIYKRTWEQHHKTREPFHEGTVLRDIANALERMLHIGSLPNLSQRDFDTMVDDLENSFAENGNFIVRQALALYADQTKTLSNLYKN